jgi:formylglycine-generating enzyme required for sulfatase activity
MKHVITAILFFIETAESAVAQKDPLNHEMVFVEGGTFQMGSNSGTSDESPVHSVTLSSYNIGKYEVTQAQWKAVMGSNPSYFEDCENCPVEQVSWNGTQEYIRKLNSQTGKNYRLPTEAEWEYAAKGGKRSKAYTYSGSNDINSVAWHVDNSERKTNDINESNGLNFVNSDKDYSKCKTHNVGGKKANELGVYDMTGNVWEWCSDLYGNYVSFKEINPMGPGSGQSRVLRGGGWCAKVRNCQTTHRICDGQDYGYYCNGFRLVLPAVR